MIDLPGAAGGSALSVAIGRGQTHVAIALLKQGFSLQRKFWLFSWRPEPLTTAAVDAVMRTGTAEVVAAMLEAGLSVNHVHSAGLPSSP